MLATRLDPVVEAAGHGWLLDLGAHLHAAKAFIASCVVRSSTTSMNTSMPAPSLSGWARLVAGMKPSRVRRLTRSSTAVGEMHFLGQFRG